jgi:hypothetical protein
MPSNIRTVDSSPSAGLGDYLLVQYDGPFLVLDVLFHHLSGCCRRKSEGFRGRDTVEVEQALGDGFRMLHLFDSDRLQRIMTANL